MKNTIKGNEEKNLGLPSDEMRPNVELNADRKIYTGIPGNHSRVTVEVRSSVTDRLLSSYGLTPYRSQKLRNHSPDGFSWGYGGSGPAQLALAILLDHFNDEKRAQKHYQDFKWAVIAKLPQSMPFQITSNDIAQALAAVSGQVASELKEPNSNA